MPTESFTRNAQEVITSVKRTFGDESGVEITDEDIIRWINDAQLEIIVANPEVNATFAQVNVTSGTTAYPLLANIPNMYSIQSIHYDGEHLQNLTFQEAQTHLIKKDIGQGDGKPLFWYERAGVVHLCPRPAVSITAGLGVFYSAKPERVTGTSTPLAVPDHYYKLVVDYCLNQAYMLDENSQMAQSAGDSFGQGLQARANRIQSETNAYPTIQIVDW